MNPNTHLLSNLVGWSIAFLSASHFSPSIPTHTMRFPVSLFCSLTHSLLSSQYEIPSEIYPHRCSHEQTRQFKRWTSDFIDNFINKHSIVDSIYERCCLRWITRCREKQQREKNRSIEIIQINSGACMVLIPFSFFIGCYSMRITKIHKTRKGEHAAGQKYQFYIPWLQSNQMKITGPKLSG